jgi:hypothetical protein
MAARMSQPESGVNSFRFNELWLDVLKQVETVDGGGYMAAY